MSEDAPRLNSDVDTNGSGIAPAPPFVSKVTQVLPRVTPWFTTAFERQAREEITWEIGLLQFPTNNRGEFISLVGLFVAIPGSILGTVIMANQQIQPYGLTEELVDQFVRQVLESLRESRSQQLAEMEAASKQNATNGRATPTNGLIVPGR